MPGDLSNVVTVLLERVEGLCTWLGKQQMYAWNLEYTNEKLNDAKNALEDKMKDVLSFLEVERMERRFVPGQAIGWLRQGMSKLDLAGLIIDRYQHEFADNNVNGCVRMLLCPCNTVSRRMFNLDAVVRINILKQHRDDGPQYNIDGGMGIMNNLTLQERIDALLLPLPQVTITRIGPFPRIGSEDGFDRDIAVFNFTSIVGMTPQRLTNVTITTGGIIDAFSFSYIGQDGQLRTVGPWGAGGNADAQTHVINLQATEVVREISGTMAKAEHTPTAPTVITSIGIVTSLAVYEPMGQPLYKNNEEYPNNNTPFRVVAPDDKAIVGFFGRSDRYLNEIGVYMIQV